MEECWIEEMAARHRIGAAIFTPFVITRLQGDMQATEATLTVTLRGISQAGETSKRLRLRWRPESVPSQPLGVQEKVVTEWAACGIACVLVSLYTSFQVLSVADEGDRFDYWVGDEKQEIGLEVSGTLSSDPNELEARHRLKIRQLQDNPHGVDGYVVVAALAARQVIFSFNRFAEESEP